MTFIKPIHSRITADIPVDTKEKLERIADEGTRTLANLIRKILYDFCNNLLVEISPDIRTNLENIAKKEGRPISHIVCQTLTEYCNNYNKENAQDKEP